ncbi:hypothetical protein BDY21DRAFT_370007 [Lineolata rhizophorae]|uniref:non-specific serine/threonine protein kinase n=1 Tax=Lineolata rhizophorae TaxID=578093 RepID=A0A6A6P7X9_9PEZI|nr:hypothetical protein BDY21DRAFT_370007 [Lineolata rhizophorae]
MPPPAAPITMAPPPAVTALKQEAAAAVGNLSGGGGGDGSGGGRPITQMERSISMDIREEKEELKEAAEQSRNVVMDLALDGRVRWVSASWERVVGTKPEEVQGKPVADVLVDDKNVFAEAIESMGRDDSRSRLVRFRVPMGPSSAIRRKRESRANSRQEGARGEEGESTEQVLEEDEEDILDLEAQGMMVYDPASGGESHTMWMVRPQVIREVTIDLPEILVESLGVGAEMLANYLTALAEVGANDPGNHPPPLPVLCRICERQITPWWFEKHTELCLQEHHAEMDVQMAQEALTEHRNTIVKILDALEAQRQPRPTSGEVIASARPVPEYKGFPIGPPSTPSSGPSSGRASPASPPSRSRERPVGLGHARAKSFGIRRPAYRIVELVLDLCDTALEINMPSIKDTRTQLSTDIRTISPQSENRISQVVNWETGPSSSQDQGLAALSDDTSRLSKQKVDAVNRYRRILEYSERIRVEFDIRVQECIDAAMRKAAKIAAGELTDSSEDTTSQSGAEAEAEGEAEDDTEAEAPLDTPAEEAMFPASFDGPSAMATALGNASDSSLTARLERSTSSAAGSATRSSSPGGTQTPRSHPGAMSFVSQSKRASMQFESDAGGDSDSSVRSSVLSAGRRAESPGSEYNLSRVASSRERKRRSLILPSMMGNSRQQSPARGMVPPSSPLRMSKPRIPSGSEGVQSPPVTSPVLSTTEFSSPAIPAMAGQPHALHHHHHHHHRRQSSAAVSEHSRPPLSPRLIAVSNPQPRAQPPSIKDFEIIKPISKGAFGSVYLSKKKSTGEYFAIKVLKKADMVAKNQVTNVKSERAIMIRQGESDFVAKLYWTFSSKDYLYLVMEYLNGGDCASLVKVLGGLSEDWAKKYLAEVVLGVENLHSQGIVHRDLKPDNLLIDQKGHLKLTDFGLSRMGLIGRQKRALARKPEDTVPDLLKQGPFQRAVSSTSSRSASFDFQEHSPGQTPNLAPATGGDIGMPSYFNLSRESSVTQAKETSRRTSRNRSDSGDSEALQAAFRRLSIADESAIAKRRTPIEEEKGFPDEGSPDAYALRPSLSQASIPPNSSTPPQGSIMPPPDMTLFDPEDSNRKFVGTPDYLAPETINGVGQDEVSDWWSLGCILFECLYGYPPFHADTPEKVFENILDRKIDWPDEDAYDVSDEAKDLMNKLMCTDPTQRLGANKDDKYASGGDEVRHHPWFADINWETLREDEASFVPAPENPEDTEYFDARGADMANFDSEFEDQGATSTGTPGADYTDRPHDALSRVRSQVNSSSMKRGLIPLHIPPHVRDGRNRRLSEPVPVDDFGSFTFKNLPVLEKANKDVIQKLRAEAMQAQSKAASSLNSPGGTSPAPSLESSPVIPGPLKRTLSTNKGGSNVNRPASPSLLSQPNSSPNRQSQPSSPLLVSFTTGQNHERRKTSSGSSSLSAQNSSLHPGGFFDVPRLPNNMKPPSSTASSPIKVVKTPGAPPSLPQEKTYPGQRQTSGASTSGGSAVASPRTRSQTLGSQEGETLHRDSLSSHYKRRSQVMDISPSSSDNEDGRAKAVMKYQRRRHSSRRHSQFNLADGPVFRPLDVLVCEDHPVSRIVMEKLLEKLRCRCIVVSNGHDAMRYGMGEVKFDIIMMEFNLPQMNGADVARMIREIQNTNKNTPIVAVTGYLKDLQAPHHFDALIEKPPTVESLTEVLGRLCQWKPPPPGWTGAVQHPVPHHLAAAGGSFKSAMHPGGGRYEDSPTSNSSGFAGTIPSSSYRGSSREDSVSSSFFGDTDSRSDDVSAGLSRQTTDDWRERERDRDLARVFGGLGISGTGGGGGGVHGHQQQQPEPTQPIAVQPRSSTHGSMDSGKVLLPPLSGAISSNSDHVVHQSSAPAALEHPSMPGRKARSNAAVMAPPSDRTPPKRRPGDGTRKPPRLQESAESGDDEDEELGDKHVRAKSPKGGARGVGSGVGAGAAGAGAPGFTQLTTSTSNAGSGKRSSKLSTEMMRTNSHGSVVSVEDMAAATEALASSPPPCIDEDVVEEAKGSLARRDVEGADAALARLEGAAQTAAVVKEEAEPSKTPELRQPWVSTSVENTSVADFARKFEGEGEGEGEDEDEDKTVKRSSGAMTPPEIFPKRPGGEVVTVEAPDTTPTAGERDKGLLVGEGSESPDPDPTPKAGASPMSGGKM